MFAYMWNFVIDLYGLQIHADLWLILPNPGFGTTHSSHQKFLVAQQQLLPEGVELVFQKFAKDLGSCINYSKFRFLGCVKDRILSTLADFVKLQYMQIPMEEKVQGTSCSLATCFVWGRVGCTK